MSELITALGLALVLEGIFYALFPNAAKQMMAYLLSSPERTLRVAGISAMLGGLVIVGLVRGFT